MKRILSFALIFILLFSALPQMSYAEDFLEYGSVELIDGISWEAGTYTTVGLMFAGDSVVSDVPSVLYELDGKTRTLIPVGVIADLIGANISWNGDTQEVSINFNGKTIVLKIDSDTAYIDGKPYSLPNKVPAKLMSYNGITRTMVPVNILDQFGLDFAWNGETRTVEINYPHQDITDIVYDDSGRFQEIHVMTTGQVLTTSYFMDGSLLDKQDKIIIDFENTGFELPSYKIRDGKRTIDLIYGSIDKIVTYQVEGESKTRMEIELLNRKGYDIFYDEAKQMVVIRFINSVRDIRTEQIYSSEAVVINTGEYPAFNVDYLQGKVVVDVVNSLMRYHDGKDGEVQVNEGGVKSISYSQFDTTGSPTFNEDDIVSRVVVNLDKDTSVEDVYVENIDNEIFIYVSGDPLNGFDYVKNSLDSAQLTMNFTEMGKVDSTYNESTRNLRLEVNKSSVDLSAMNVAIDDSIIDSISINDKANTDKYIINIKLSEGTAVAGVPGDGYSNGIHLGFANEALKNSIWRNTLIVVDAGHGGTDSGAVGSLVTESKLTLVAAKEFEKRLQSVGFKTYMIRDADVKIAPSYRMRVANDIGADLVVSIHINAAENKKARGVEVLYAEEPTGKKKQFASILQENLIDTLGSVDRGIVHRPNLYMCRVPTMPSALVELGFISNEEEQKRMMTSTFMKSAAQAMLDAVLEFLK